MPAILADEKKLVLINWCKRHQMLVSSLCLLAFWIILLCNPINKITGFDQEDDHNIAAMDREFNKGVPFGNQLSLELQSDKGMRFRPLWVVYRVGAVKLFGTNWALYSIAHALMAALSSILLYLAGRNIGFSFLTGITFSIVVLLGPQLQGYIWRAPQEPLAMLFTCTALYFVCRSIKAQGHAIPELIGVIFATLGIIFIKESFVLIFPALAFLRVSLLTTQHPPRQALQRSVLWLLCLAAITALGLGIIIVNAGVGPGYMGIDAQAPDAFNIYLSSSEHLLKTIPGLLFVLSGFLFACASYAGNTLYYRKPWFIALGAVIFAFAWAIPQIILFAKSGFYPRYLLPAVTGLWLSTFVLFSYARQYSRSVYRQLFVLLSLGIILQSYSTFKYMVGLGEWRKNWTNVIMDIEKHGKADAKILVLVDPSEDYGYAKCMFDFLTGHLHLAEDNVHVMFDPAPPYEVDADNRMHKIGVLAPLYRNNVVAEKSLIASYDVFAVPKYQVDKGSFYPLYGPSLQGSDITTGTKFVHFYF